MRLILPALVLPLTSTAWGGHPNEFSFLQQARTTRQATTAVVPAQEQQPVVVRGSVPGPGSQAGADPSQPDSAVPGDTARQATPRSEGDSLSLTFTNAKIETVVNTVMKALGYSYIIDPQVTGSISLYTYGEVSQDRLFGILERLLKLNGYGIVRQEGIYTILPLGETPKIPGRILLRPESGETPEQDAGSAPPQETLSPPSEESANPTAQETGQVDPALPTSPLTAMAQQLEEEEGVITYIIPLHYIPSSEMVTMAKAFVSDGATVIDFQSANLILLTDYRNNVKHVLRLVHLLDTRYFELNTVDLVPIQYNQAVDVAQDLGMVFAPNEQAGGVRIVAIERLNSLLLVTRSPAVLAEVKSWIERLDAPASGSSLKTFVYPAQNNTAANIAEVLAQLYSDGGGLPQTGIPSQQEGAAPGDQMFRRQQAGFVGERQQQAFGSLGPALSSRSAQSSVRAVVSGDIKIIVNEFNNSLIIQGTEADYQFLEQTIKQLDVLPRQVLIEARIYSVELKNDLSFGVSAFLRGLGRGAEEGGTVGPATTGSIGSDQTGGAISAMTRIAIGGERQLEFIINALRRKTNVEMLEAPTLLVLDGTQAQINVGAEVPVTTASFGDPIRSGSGTAFVNSIQFRPTGTTLLMLPRITASGVVTMDVAIEVSAATGDALTPTINRNFVQTSLIAQDNQTVAIAGVISDSLTKVRSRVPILGDIPVLGALFGQTSRNKRRFELIFMITPRVIRNLPTALELTIDFKRALQNTYDYVERTERQREDLIERRRRQELELEQQTQQPPSKLRRR